MAAGVGTSGCLNLHQCAYHATNFDDHFNTVVTPSGDGRYSTGTKHSATADTTAACGAGDGDEVGVRVAAARCVDHDVSSTV
ncbi:hypothetical protein ACFVYR_05590 [Streptomyces sp. NPDC058284]|uniref:hypothetical protein n=1 Tax=unclassified Streptomyces TaxID=2593676 RepID=UPI0036696328